jgi:hypothetical protein
LGFSCFCWLFLGNYCLRYFNFFFNFFFFSNNFDWR